MPNIPTLKKPLANKKPSVIEKLLSHSDIWRAANKPVSGQGISTGLYKLDKALHHGGWPCSGLTELLLAAPGCGELRLLAPCLANLSQRPGLLALINPPYIPYAPGLLAYGIDVSRILVIRTDATADALWSTEQALRSGACNAVLSWLPDRAVNQHHLRKLQLAAQQQHGLGALLRPAQATRHHSPAALRIEVSLDKQQYRLNIIKQRGGWGGQRISLPLPKRLSQRQLSVSQLPVYNRRQTASSHGTQTMQPLADLHAPGHHGRSAIH